MNIKLLQQGCESLGLNLEVEQITLIKEYINLLVKWNKVYNLTAVTETDDIVIRHILDSLSIIKYIENDFNIIDIGSGAGLPGVMIAILKPSCHVTLLDSNSKRTTFLEQIKIQLKLNNLQVVTSRVEKFEPKQKFDAVIARAFAQLASYVKVTAHLVKDQGIIWSMKGKLNSSELEDFKNDSDNSDNPLGFELNEIYELQVPFLNEERHLIKIIRKN